MRHPPQKRAARYYLSAIISVSQCLHLRNEILLKAIIEPCTDEVIPPALSSRPRGWSYSSHKPSELAWNCAKSHMEWNSWPTSQREFQEKHCISDLIHFFSLFLSVRVALFHIPCSPSHSSRYTPFDLSGEKVLRKEKKRLNHGRDSAVLLVWQVLWAQSRVERRRRG